MASRPSWKGFFRNPTVYVGIRVTRFAPRNIVTRPAIADKLVTTEIPIAIWKARKLFSSLPFLAGKKP